MNHVRRIFGIGREMHFLQQNLGDTIDQIADKPIIDGLLIKDVILTASSIKVPHMLGRAPQGHMIVYSNANQSVWNSQTSDTFFLYLQAGGDVTVSLWVF